MVLPLVPLALIGIGVISGTGGTALGLKGAFAIKRSNSRIVQAGERYDGARRELELHEQHTNELLKGLGVSQEKAIASVVDRMADFLRRHEKQVAESDKLLVDGLEPTTGQVVLDGGLGQDAYSWMRGIAGSAVTGVGINAGITTAVGTFAVASTGTAISTLTGAAATKATLAYLGGGSLAAGGGGMAAGAVALNVVAIGPAILVSGFMVAGQGEKALTRATENEAEIATAIAEMQVTKAGFDAIDSRVEELEQVLDQLAKRATSALDLLESEPFEPSRHAVCFRQSLTLAVAVRDVATTQVVDESGVLNEESASVKVRYRTLIKEVIDV